MRFLWFIGQVIWVSLGADESQMKNGFIIKVIKVHQKHDCRWFLICKLMCLFYLFYLDMNACQDKIPVIDTVLIRLLLLKKHMRIIILFNVSKLQGKANTLTQVFGCQFQHHGQLHSVIFLCAVFWNCRSKAIIKVLMSIYQPPQSSDVTHSPAETRRHTPEAKSTFPLGVK